MRTSISFRILLIALGALALLGGIAVASSASGEPQAEQLTSLREGNRLYREGRLEEAVDAYLAGYDSDPPHPVLAYNMATTTHHLGRLPEAILWYRRAQAANPGDPWMQENLSSARASLGLQPYPAPGISGLVSSHTTALLLMAAVVAWIGLLLWIARPRRSSTGAMLLFALGTLFYGAIYLTARNAPRAAVVLEDCSADEGDLPAGSEIWVTGGTDDQFRIVAGGVTLECPRETVSLVQPGEL